MTSDGQSQLKNMLRSIVPFDMIIKRAKDCPGNGQSLLSTEADFARVEGLSALAKAFSKGVDCMFHQTIYASRDTRCKEPFGAVAAEETIRFYVFVLYYFNCFNKYIVIA